MSQDEAGEKPKGGGLVPTLLAVAVLTAVAGGGGAFMGMLLGDGGADAAAAPEQTASPESEETAGRGERVLPDGKGAQGTHEAAALDGASLLVVPLKPIITNIFAPANVLVRMEASLVLNEDGDVDPQVLAARIEADTLVFLRSVQLAQLEGARGIRHLREDLMERARLRSPAVVDYLIQSMVAE